MTKTPSGWESVNKNAAAEPSRVVDITTEPLPYETGSMPAVEMTHIPRNAITKHSLSEAVRVLAPGGRLRISTGDIGKEGASAVQDALRGLGIKEVNFSNDGGEYIFWGTK
jgi:hypothetical protein